MSRSSSPEKQVADHNIHVLELGSTEVSPTADGDGVHSRSFFGLMRTYRWAITWCVYMLWCILANNYAKTAGQSVLGIPQFRKDFGSPYQGNYVLSARWQSAYYGAPQAA